MPMLSLDVGAIREAMNGLSWNWTAIGTVALAAATVALLIYTIFSTRRERSETEAREERDRAEAERRADRDRADAERRAERDRADAERRLREDRQLAEERIREERTMAADIRRRDRQRADAAVLIERVSVLQPLLGGVLSLTLRERAGDSSFPNGPSFTQAEDAERRQAVESLRRGGWTEAALLGTGDAAREAAGRYRHLVRLVDRATLGSLPGHNRVVDSLSNYSTWVRMSLQDLAASETVPLLADGAQATPDLDQDTDDVWKPDPEPPGWDAETKLNRPIRRAAIASSRKRDDAPPPSQ